MGFRLCEEGAAGKEKGRKKYLVFYLEEKVGKIIFDVPKAKGLVPEYRDKSEKLFFEILKYNNQARYGNLVKETC